MLSEFPSIPSVVEHGPFHVYFQAFNSSLMGVDMERMEQPPFFTETEWQGIKTHPLSKSRYALEWAGKQAAYQAITSQGFRNVRLEDFEIWHDEAGAPHLRAAPSNRSECDFHEFAISMSDEGDRSIGAAVALQQPVSRTHHMVEDQIQGIGVDIATYTDLEGVPENIWQTILLHTFTPEEIRESLAGSDKASQVKNLTAVFAGKEAVFKSFSRLLHQEWLSGNHPGAAAIDFREIEILGVSMNRPRVNLPEGFQQVAQHQRANTFKIRNFFVSDLVVTLALCLKSETS